MSRCVLVSLETAEPFMRGASPPDGGNSETPAIQPVYGRLLAGSTPNYSSLSRLSALDAKSPKSPRANAQSLKSEKPKTLKYHCPMSTQTVRLHRWDEIALEKVTEMISRKIVTGDREMLAQIYLKKGAMVPIHSHESEQMTYVLQGAMKFLVGGEEITLREGEVLHIPSWMEHQAEALDDTFELDFFSPIRQDWIDHTDTYFHK
jgi:quercetin dioxygenase-like cupin family protein